MNYGMYVSGSGVLTSLYRMDVLSNNLANVGTVGFKADRPGVMQREAARAEDGLGFMPSNALLERLGAGVMSAGNRVSFTQGSLSTTGNPLDVAIRGDGFFVVQDSAGTGTERFRLTRDGRFTRDREGRLVSATTGMAVMDLGNRPIFIADDAPVSIDARGVIRQRNVEVARLQLVDVADRSRLAKVGHGMFRATGEAWSGRRAAGGLVVQNAVEESAVDPVEMMMRITDAGRAAESNMGMVNNHNQMLERAINTFGRVS